MSATERNKIQSENDAIVHKATMKAWEYLHKKTVGFTDARRYIIFARVTGFFVGNVYLPQVDQALVNAEHIIENEHKTE